MFDYKGDKDAEDKILDDCINGDLCYCTDNKKECGASAIRECFPAEPGNANRDVTKGIKDEIKQKLFLMFH